MLITGNGELGFDSGEGAWEMATTSKEGSRRVNYTVPIRRGSDDKYQYHFKKKVDFKKKIFRINFFLVIEMSTN